MNKACVCLHLPWCNQLRVLTTRGQVRAPSCQLHWEHHRAVLAKGFGQRGYLLMHGAIGDGLFLTPQAGLELKSICLERILYRNFISYPTPLSSTHIALNSWAAHTFTTPAHSLQTMWVSPHPLHFLLGGLKTPTGTLVYGCWTVPTMCLTPLPSLSCSPMGYTKKVFLLTEHECPL